ncbi:MAG: metallophosphoesterase [Gammaproteobacteria bacterium]|nr:metallophosphoesterase [Gammaproteobacteria bacterium]
MSRRPRLGAQGRAAALTVVAFACFALRPAAAAPAAPVWVQYGPEGRAEVRAVVRGGTCPMLRIDGGARAMDLRAAPSSDFPRVCAAELPPDARHASVFGRALALPVAHPHRILVIGDTGCRIKGGAVQDCNDPRQWPFARLAAEAARLRPDLIIDLGDYLYRESACPTGDRRCAGSPHGDHFATWRADFFAPAAPLLAAAPWVLVRGNHEDCQRAGEGWLRMMGPQPFMADARCATHLPPYTVPIGRINLVVMDDADAPDTRVAADAVAAHAREFAALAQSPAPTWLLMHRPIWGAISGPLDVPVGGNRTLIAALGRSGVPAPVELMLAGHIHAFEILNYAGAQRAPAQLIAGFGGDRLDRTPENLAGTWFQGGSAVRVASGESIPGFGFVMLRAGDRGWAIDVHDVDGRIERRCWFREQRLGCAPL